MNQSSPESSPLKTGFTSLAEARSALKLLVAPVTDDQQKRFLAQLSASSHPKQIAFRLLALLLLNQAGRNEKLLSLLQPDLTDMLAGGVGSNPEDLAAIPIDDVALWVRRQFPSVTTLQEAKAYLETEKHLWTLYQILRWSGDAAKFMTAISRFTEELESLTMTRSGGKKRREAKKSAGLPSVVATIIKRVPARPAAVESLLENLRLCRACAQAASQLQEDLEASRARNEYLKTELEKERAAHAMEKSARETAEAVADNTQKDLLAEKAKVSRMEETLKIQAGAHEADKMGTSAEVLTAIRRKLVPDLENIRLYADRAEPNSAAIIRKTQELTQFLTDYKPT